MYYLTKGAVAPDFTLTNQDEQQVNLSQLLKTNRVLVYFYPKAMTPGCTVQACGLRDTQQQLQDKGVTVVGISTDSPARLKKFAERDNLNFTLLADEDHKVADAYGVWGEKQMFGHHYMGVHRTTFVIDEKGVIRKIFLRPRNKAHAEEILALP